IVVDDGSIDDSVSVLLERFGDRIKVLEQENQGPGAARNHGLHHASGDYVKFLDSDDLCTLNLLEAQLYAARAANADFCYAPWIRVQFDDSAQKVVADTHVMQDSELPQTLDPVDAMLGGWTIIFQACLIRRTFLERSDGYRTDLLNFEDAEYLFRLMLQGPVITFTNEGFIVYRYHEADRLSEAGVSTPRKRRDAVLFLECMGESLAASGLDPRTHQHYLFLLRRLKAERELGDCLKESEDSGDPVALPARTGLRPLPITTRARIKLAETRQRFLDRRTRQETGFPWPAFFGTCEFSSSHRKQIEELGFSVREIGPVWAGPSPD
ncbi:glycosyltransferase family 2 protein, partial [bacterium]|nr:glycosyltransferase family 2 protein [bacterium]